MRILVNSVRPYLDESMNAFFSFNLRLLHPLGVFTLLSNQRQTVYNEQRHGTALVSVIV